MANRPFLFETRSGRVYSGVLFEHPRACVIRHSANGYWELDGPHLDVEFRAGLISFEYNFESSDPSALPVPKRGFYVFLDHGFDFRDLDVMRNSFSGYLRDPIVLEVWE